MGDVIFSGVSTVRSRFTCGRRPVWQGVNRQKINKVGRGWEEDVSEKGLRSLDQGLCVVCCSYRVISSLRSSAVLLLGGKVVIGEGIAKEK
jgi:hypothetical protein